MDGTEDAYCRIGRTDSFPASLQAKTEGISKLFDDKAGSILKHNIFNDYVEVPTCCQMLHLKIHYCDYPIVLHSIIS